MEPTAADRIAPTRRPDEWAIGHQKWRHLLFVHWRVPVEVLRPLIPAGLTIDTFDGSAWVGLIPFHMTGVRPAWSPPVPGISTLHETNVRTYVHVNGRDPGVWFFSLDASSSLAVRVARWKWSLPYFRAQMKVQRDEAGAYYHSRRLWPGPPGAGCTVETEIGAACGTLRTEPPDGPAAVDSLEFFLIERYLLYTQAADGSLWRGQIHHQPYPLRQARLVSLNDTLVGAAGIDVPPAPEHVTFSDGVDVEVFRLKRVHARR